ncbi:MAG: type I restriction endonuclease subunit R [Armatimonadetes bacterium]|nr:type I restriction endonuclease subunit R [Armatimonadota bacterium]
MKYTEDTLVQTTTADYFEQALGWDSLVAYNSESYGPGSLLGRENDREVVLTRDLLVALETLNPGLPAAAYDDAVRQVVGSSVSQTLLDTNREKYAMIRDGVRVTYRNAKGEVEKPTLKLIEFDNPDNNRFLVVRELWVRGDIYRRRMDLIGFVNGLPLLFIECKNIHKDLRKAYDQNLSDYRDTVPHILHHNAVVMLANGHQAKIGSITSKFEHFHEWKRLAEDDPGAVDMETLLKGVCSKANFLDIVENFIVFDDSSGKPVKILGKNHQLLGVNKALAALTQRKERAGKLGVFWHTQGSGKSYSMVFFTRKAHRKLGGHFTFLVCTDREDLDRQIYNSFAGCGVVNNDRDPCRAASCNDLRSLLGQQKTHVFTLVQKFAQDVAPDASWSRRDDIIVISDEAHRTQYGNLALNMRNALPHASYIGFTGTPLFRNDELTRQVFGDYVSTYDFQRAVQDGATVPLYYDARGEKLRITTKGLNKKIAEVLERVEAEGTNVQQKLEAELKRDYHVITAPKRVDAVARDLVRHYSTSWETGKAMLVCIDKITCVRLHKLIEFYWQERIKELEAIPGSYDDQEAQYVKRQVAWMRETRIAVMISEEQGEVQHFERWHLDIRPYRKLIKEGFDAPGGERIDLESAFKRDEHPFRIAIVCAMWLTGFDVPSLANLYLDKPLKAHTLMQAIARANRLHEGKANGLIVDYCGILKGLREALATFAGTDDPDGGGGIDPVRPQFELIAELAAAIEMARTFLSQNGASLEAITHGVGFERNAAITRAKEAANQTDETRKRFEVICREVFRRFKACLTIMDVNLYRRDHDAVDVVYKMLQDDTQAADISDIIQRLHGVVGEAVQLAEPQPVTGDAYNISRIDFDKLRREFEKSDRKNTTVQELKAVIEKRLALLLARNPLLTDFEEHYKRIIEEYNAEKDRATIEKTFEELLKFVQELDEEGTRAAREGLDAESLAVFDLLRKDDLTKEDIGRIKKVAVDLLDALKAEKLRVDQWREKEATRDAVKVTIRDFLWSDIVGLPAPAYTEADVEAKSADVFRHVYYAYPTVPSPVYAVVG